MVLVNAELLLASEATAPENVDGAVITDWTEICEDATWDNTELPFWNVMF